MVPESTAHKNRISILRAAHDAKCSAITSMNQMERRKASEQHAVLKREIDERNEQKVGFSLGICLPNQHGRMLVFCAHECKMSHPLMMVKNSLVRVYLGKCHVIFLWR